MRHFIFPALLAVLLAVGLLLLVTAPETETAAVAGLPASVALDPVAPELLAPGPAQPVLAEGAGDDAPVPPPETPVAAGVPTQPVDRAPLDPAPAVPPAPAEDPAQSTSGSSVSETGDPVASIDATGASPVGADGAQGGQPGAEAANGPSAAEATATGPAAAALTDTTVNAGSAASETPSAEITPPDNAPPATAEMSPDETAVPATVAPPAQAADAAPDPGAAPPAGAADPATDPASPSAASARLEAAPDASGDSRAAPLASPPKPLPSLATLLTPDGYDPDALSRLVRTSALGVRQKAAVIQAIEQAADPAAQARLRAQLRVSLGL